MHETTKAVIALAQQIRDLKPKDARRVMRELTQLCRGVSDGEAPKGCRAEVREAIDSVPITTTDLAEGARIVLHVTHDLPLEPTGLLGH